MAYHSYFVDRLIPNSVISIGNGAFASCEKLTTVAMSDSIVSIGKNAFKNCGSLKNIVLPDSVTSVGESAFMDCKSLESVEFEQTEGWYVLSSQVEIGGTKIDSNDLADTQKATELITQEYNDRHWKREELTD